MSRLLGWLVKLGGRAVLDRIKLVERYYSDLESSSRDALGIELGHGDCIFLVGGPGSGKSTYKRSVMRSNVIDLDPDEVKVNHEEYRDVQLPIHVHHWSKEVLHNYFYDVVEGSEKSPFIWDTTGADKKDVYAKMRAARIRGYKVYVVWVVIPQELAIVRNRQRDRFENDEPYIWNSVYKIESNLEELIERGSVRLSELYVYSRYDGEELERAIAELERIPVRKYDERPVVKERASAERGERSAVVGEAIKRYEEKREFVLRWFAKLGIEEATWAEFIRYYTDIYDKVHEKGDVRSGELDTFFREFRPLFNRYPGRVLKLEYLSGLGRKQS